LISGLAGIPVRRSGDRTEDHARRNARGDAWPSIHRPGQAMIPPGGVEAVSSSCFQAGNAALRWQYFNVQL